MSQSFLTERQREILEFIREFSDANGIAPTHREICEKFNYSSYGTVHKHLRLLREKGYLRRVQHQKRGLELVDEGEELGSLIELPFLGRIAAGQPIEALPGHETFGVPPALLAGRMGQKHYILRVTGSSMIEEGIHDGDFVIVESVELAPPGAMVVALIDGEATLKHYHPEGPFVRLQPANAAMDPILVPADRLKIQGVVVGLMRKY